MGEGVLAVQAPHSSLVTRHLSPKFFFIPLGDLQGLQQIVTEKRLFARALAKQLGIFSVKLSLRLSRLFLLDNSQKRVVLLV
jgi:hypothetical protein